MINEALDFSKLLTTKINTTDAPVYTLKYSSKYKTKAKKLNDKKRLAVLHDVLIRLEYDYIIPQNYYNHSVGKNLYSVRIFSEDYILVYYKENNSKDIILTALGTHKEAYGSTSRFK